MGTEITEAMVKQYADNFMLMSQQKKSRLEPYVRLKPGIVGQSATVDAVGSTTARKRTTRNDDSPVMKTPFYRRWIDLSDYDWGDLIDEQDLQRLTTDPTSSVIASGLAALNRSKDSALITAMGGSARTLDAGTTSVALPSAQKIAIGGAGLTLSKLITAKEILSAAEAYNEDDPEDQLVIAVAARQITDLLGDDKLTSAEYNTVRALVAGAVDTFMGFKFVRTQLLTKVTTTRSVYAWCKSGVVLGTGQDITRELTRRADKSFAAYPYAKMSIGATRTEEEKVVEIACLES